ncbi:hypothetical protein DPMN_147834 [Dreissena polymorpha]|uniref:Uncharacterized protein n=1 Tax=Dreissena polymorpha TaxID=45954 RepID=A0A9D4F8Y5_DREPO|nr:hypothetical protein DPMN_147834 [Dreissena polymorpha]
MMNRCSMHEQYLYRILKETENIGYGLKAGDPMSTRMVCQHVESGSKYPPRFLSTCGTLEADRLFASKSWKQPKRIAQIDCVRLQQENQDVQFIDLRNPSVRQYHISPDNEKLIMLKNSKRF